MGQQNKVLVVPTLQLLLAVSTILRTILRTNPLHHPLTAMYQPPVPLLPTSLAPVRVTLPRPPG